MPAPIDRLRAHSRAGRTQIVVAQAGQQSAHGAREGPPAQRAPQLAGAPPPGAPGHSPETRERQSARQIGEVDVGAAVALALQGEHRVRPGQDASTHLLRQVDAQERQRRIRHGVDETVHRRSATDGELTVLAAERHDDDAGVGARQAGDAITVQTGAVDGEACHGRAAPGVEDDLGAAAGDGHDARPGAHLPAVPRQAPRQGGRDGGVVGHGGGGHMQRAQTAAGRLDLAQPLGADQRQSRDAVRGTAAVDLRQTRQLALFGRHDDLAAAPVRHAVLLAEQRHRRGPLDTAWPSATRARSRSRSG